MWRVRCVVYEVLSPPFLLTWPPRFIKIDMKMKDGARLFAIMLITKLKKQGEDKAVEIVLETLKELDK